MKYLGRINIAKRKAPNPGKSWWYSFNLLCSNHFSKRVHFRYEGNTCTWLYIAYLSTLCLSVCLSVSLYINIYIVYIQIYSIYSIYISMYIHKCIYILLYVYIYVWIYIHIYVYAVIGYNLHSASWLRARSSWHWKVDC